MWLLPITSVVPQELVELIIKKPYHYKTSKFKHNKEQRFQKNSMFSNHDILINDIFGGSLHVLKKLLKERQKMLTFSVRLTKFGILFCTAQSWSSNQVKLWIFLLTKIHRDHPLQLRILEDVLHCSWPSGNSHCFQQTQSRIYLTHMCTRRTFRRYQLLKERKLNNLISGLDYWVYTLTCQISMGSHPYITPSCTVHLQT